jgi:3-phenylpropionate/trans-cinnamate dioxygenase ferredoxin reductase subunit
MMSAYSFEGTKMGTSTTRIVIIGAGECGVRAALALREQGFDGSLDLINGEPYEPYERPPLSKPTDEGLALKSIAGTGDLAAKGIRHHLSLTATSIDRGAQSVTLSNGSSLMYDWLLIATGARPRPLTLNGVTVAGLSYLREFNDAKAIYDNLKAGRHIAIIGGGFIGLELAVQARLRGVNVTVLEAGPRLLGRAVPAEIASVIEKRHRDEGVTVICDAKIIQIDANRVITLEDGRVILSDLIVAGVGSLPNTELASSIGLRVENGIVVDGHLATSDPLIFAAGDCCTFPHPLYGGAHIRIESWRAALEQGEHAARAMLGSDDIYQSVPWFWSDQYDLGMQIAGLAGEASRTIRRDIGQDAFILFHLGSDGRLLAASGIGIGNSVARDIRLSEMLISKLVCPDALALADPSIGLK